MRALERLAVGTSGQALLEVAAAVGIMAMGIGLVGGGTFQALSIERFWRADAVATRDLRHAGSRFARDALNAEATDLVDGAPPAEGVSLTWTGSDGAPHLASYTVESGVLTRTLDGATAHMAGRVVAAGFSRSGAVLAFDLEVEGPHGTTRSFALETYLRRLQP